MQTKLLKQLGDPCVYSYSYPYPSPYYYPSYPNLYPRV